MNQAMQVDGGPSLASSPGRGCRASPSGMEAACVWSWGEEPVSRSASAKYSPRASAAWQIDYTHLDSKNWRRRRRRRKRRRKKMVGWRRLWSERSLDGCRLCYTSSSSYASSDARIGSRPTSKIVHGRPTQTAPFLGTSSAVSICCFPWKGLCSRWHRWDSHAGKLPHHLLFNCGSSRPRRDQATLAEATSKTRLIEFNVWSWSLP
mmetsp:Transcript_44940/g.96544  ORF Transcript_44940/g.96544 Transcript_44940/m.96544 type:complete len:206 (-) Transcript_44940:1433-2050(-)